MGYGIYFLILVTVWVFFDWTVGELLVSVLVMLFGGGFLRVG